MSKYRIAIIDIYGEPVFLVPGGIGERDLVDTLLANVEAKGVGLARTTTHVLKDVEDALVEVLRDLKSEVMPRSK